MRIKEIETTPNPNCMKLVLSERSGNHSVTYTAASRAGCPPFVERLLAIPGVRSVFLLNDFVTLTREGKAEWQPILDAASAVFSGEAVTLAATSGAVKVQVQTFRGVPIQVKAADGRGEKRVALPDRFVKAAQEIQSSTGANFLKERHWVDHGTRYGDLEAVAAAMAAELEALLDEEQLALVQTREVGAQRVRPEPTADWELRYQALQAIGASAEAVEPLAAALKDSDARVRRFAAALLGGTGSPLAVAPLCEALSDPAVGVRRTAGDSLSDIGDPAATEAMCAALADQSKLVRWRAARFLNEVGTAEAIPHLERATGDPEFEVRFEAEAAIRRISSGQPPPPPMWKRISERP